MVARSVLIAEVSAAWLFVVDEKQVGISWFSGSDISPMKHSIIGLDLAVVDAFAVGAHAGQVDKNGDPYIAHPRAVAKLVPLVPSFRSLDQWQKEAAIMAALLHDVLEDTAASRLDMVSIGIPVPVVDIVGLLTFPGGEDRQDYYAALYQHPVARVVKIADVAHNTSAARMERLSDAVRVRLMAKYATATLALTVDHPLDAEWLTARRG